MYCTTAQHTEKEVTSQFCVNMLLFRNRSVMQFSVEFQEYGSFSVLI